MEVYQIKATVKGRIYRPSYTGTLTVYLKDGETIQQAASRILKQTSFPDGVSPDEIIVHETIRQN